MFDYSKINKESLKLDLNQTIENSKNFVSQFETICVFSNNQDQNVFLNLEVN